MIVSILIVLLCVSVGYGFGYFDARNEFWVEEVHGKVQD